MIVCRRPCTIYDVDVIGVAVLVVIALAACFGVIVPASANATEYGALSARTAAAHAKTEQTSERLGALNAEIEMLRSGVADRTRAAPKPNAPTPFLQRVASLARDYDLEISQVLPQPVQEADGYLTTEVRFLGRGTYLNFIRLLDQLARDNPYHTLQDFSIRSAADQGDPRCALSWTLRLYMLEDRRLEDAAQTP